jgi:hypothetical protein
MSNLLPKAARLLSLLCTLALGLPAAAILLTPAPVSAQEAEPLALVIGNPVRLYTGLPANLNLANDLSVHPGVVDDYTFKITYAGKTTAPKNAGTYAVKVVATTKNPPIRSVTATGILKIFKAPLLVGANDQVRLFGAANPALTLFYQGFVNGETPTVLDRRPVGATVAKPASAAGHYDITVVGGSDNNYEFLGRNIGRLTIVPTFPGTYETLLFEAFAPEVPAGKLILTLPARGGSFTGRLELTRLGGALPLAGKLQPDALLDGATGGASRKTAASETYRVSFSIGADGLVAEITFRENGSTEDIPAFSTPVMGRLAPFATTTPSPAAGRYTFALLNPTSDNPAELYPAGVGHATATVATNGALKLSGKFGDGTTLSASALPDTEGRYRFFLRPYGSRAESFAAGEFALEPHLDPARADRYYVPTSSLRFFYWRKAAKPSGTPDSLFPAGFGPVSGLVALDPWTPPSTTEPLAQRLGLASPPETSGFAMLDYGPDYLGESENDLPGAIEVAANKITPVLNAPPANPRAWKITSLNLATGRFSGAFTLVDSRPGSTQPYKRNVVFRGILRQPPSGETTVGAAYFILKPVPGGFDSDTRSVSLLLNRPD